MNQNNRINYARRSFAHNRTIAEDSLRQLQEEARAMRDFRHRRMVVGLVKRIMMTFAYLFKKRKMISLLRETHLRIHFYRQVEADLKHGNIETAIEALSIFAPPEETAGETVRRVIRNPPTPASVRNSPRVLRINMLQLRDDLIQMQRERA